MEKKDKVAGDGSGKKIGSMLPDFMRSKPGKALFWWVFNLYFKYNQLNNI